MPTEKPDSATHHTVENGPEEPSKDHATSACDPIPSAPPILPDWTPSDAELLNKISQKPVAEPRDPEAAAHKCCTKLVHNRAAEDDVSRCSARDSCPFECCTSVVHKPRKRSLPPSSRSGSNFRRQSSGLMLRGRVFYLRLRVPRALEQTVGRTHVCEHERAQIVMSMNVRIDL